MGPLGMNDTPCTRHILGMNEGPHWDPGWGEYRGIIQSYVHIHATVCTTQTLLNTIVAMATSSPPVQKH